MSTPEGAYYTDERWQNWLTRIDEEGVDLEDEDSARLRLNMQDDAVIAVAKIVQAYDEDEIDDDTALEELADVREIVLSEVDFDDEEALMLVDAVQTALVCVFYTAEEYVAGGVAEPGIDECFDAVDEAADEEDFDGALRFCVMAGTRIIDGAEFPAEHAETIEVWPVVEWIDGLDSLHEAFRDPEVVEEDDGE